MDVPMEVAIPVASAMASAILWLAVRNDRLGKDLDASRTAHAHDVKERDKTHAETLKARDEHNLTIQHRQHEAHVAYQARLHGQIAELTSRMSDGAATVWSTLGTAGQQIIRCAEATTAAAEAVEGLLSDRPSRERLSRAPSPEPSARGGPPTRPRGERR
jgi:hypothetical protein